MYYYRQLGAGRLGEAFGDAGKEADIVLRTVGMRRAAEAEWAQMPADVRKALEAYARGVNAFIHTHRDNLPLEFNLTGTTMEDWQPVDTIAFGKVMSYDLSDSWKRDLVMADVRAKLGPERAGQLFPAFPATGPFIVPGASSGSGAPAVQAYNDAIDQWLPPVSQEGLGSNNWVVDGSKSTTGKPLLSNDPHLRVQNPSIWYQVHLSTTDGKYDAVGFGFAGAPGIITGHNKDIAWGVTNVEGDVEDLFTEKLDPAGHPNQYMAADGWKPMQILTETIKVKGGDTVTQTVRITAHGPLLSDALSAISSTVGTQLQNQSFSLQWTALHPGHLFEAVYALQTASNWQEFRAALSKWSVPGQNFVYADRQGNIGYQMTGEQPIRKKGDGSVPVPGWTGEYDWSGYVPYEDLPRSYNPPEHFIATANNRPFGPDYKYPIQGDWAAPWRIDRIRELLTAKDKLGIDDFKAILTDTHSLMARDVAPYFASLKPTDPKTQEAQKLLQGWDANLSTDSVAATVYELSVQKAISETYMDDLGEDLFYQYLGEGGNSVLRGFQMLLTKPDDHLWHNGTAGKETRNDILTKALTDAVTELKGALGDDMSAWAWGKIHTITPRHVFGSQAIVSGIFNLSSQPIGGDNTTVSVSGFDFLAPFEVSHHQSYRMIIDAGDWNNSVAVYATGQSGQPYSKHWGDFLPRWQSGQYNSMLFDPKQIETNKDGVLTLTP